MSHTPTPTDRLMQLATGHYISSALNVACKLNIADRLASGPLSAGELATVSEVQEDRLYRILRFLAGVGVFQEEPERRFANNPVSDLMRKDAAGSLRYAVEFLCDPLHFRVYAELMHGVRSGEKVAERVLGMPIFEYFAQQTPEAKAENEVFNHAMTSFSKMAIGPVLKAFDFSGIGTLVDVAGGHGLILTSILQKYPQMKGVLFDLEHVVEGAKPRIRDLGLAGRCSTAHGDFFKAVPAGDAVIMKNIIHDWDDPEALTILRNCRTALGEGGKKGRVILIEFHVGPANTPSLGKMVDLEMFMWPGGRERTDAEYAALFERAGFKLTRVVPTESPFSVIEAVCA